jgi:hypothetical protein
VPARRARVATVFMVRLELEWNNASLGDFTHGFPFNFAIFVCTTSVSTSVACYVRTVPGTNSLYKYRYRTVRVSMYLELLYSYVDEESPLAAPRHTVELPPAPLAPAATISPCTTEMSPEFVIHVLINYVRT